MSAQPHEPTGIVPIASGMQLDPIIVVDEAGRSIVALLHKAAEASQRDYARAMDLVQQLSSQLRAAEEKVIELKAEAASLLDRAKGAEDWLARIHNKVEDTFFQKRTAAQQSAGIGEAEVSGYKQTT